MLSQINPVHAPTSHFLLLDLNIILSSTSGSSKWFLSVRFPHQNLVCTSPLLHTVYMPCWSHSSSFDRPDKFYEYRSLRFSLCSLLHSRVTLSLLGPSIHLTPHSRTHSAYFLPSMWATKFHIHTKPQAKLKFCISSPNLIRHQIIFSSSSYLRAGKHSLEPGRFCQNTTRRWWARFDPCEGQRLFSSSSRPDKLWGRTRIPSDACPVLCPGVRLQEPKANESRPSGAKYVGYITL
jgi:hypothetical protein